MNWGLRLLFISLLLIGCASAPKPVVKKKSATAGAMKGNKGPMPARAGKKMVPAKAVAPAPAEEPEEEEEEEVDDQFSRVKKYYKK